MQAEEILARIFPACGGTAEKSFVALTRGRRKLRWILPARQPQISRMLKSWQPYSRCSRFAWDAVRGAASLGVLHRVPGVAWVAADLAAVNWRDFGWEGRGQPLVGLYVGTEGPQQKLVALLADAATGRPRIVVKFPLGGNAWTAIAREYATLEALRSEGLVPVPTPLLLNQEKRFAAQNWLEGNPTGVKISPEHIAFLGSLAQTDQMIDLEDVHHDLLTRYERLLRENRMPAVKAAKAQALLNTANWCGQIPAVRVHGDFAPWNLKRTNEGNIVAIDWEESQSMGLPFYDLYYYREQTSRLLSRTVEVPWQEYENTLNADAFPMTAKPKDVAKIALLSAIIFTNTHEVLQI